MNFLLVLFTLAMGQAVIAHEIDNHLVGDPVVDCQDTMVSLTFTTEKPFNGRVFVKGLSDDDRCSRNFATNQDQSKFSMMINNGDCAMQRQRTQGELEGIMFSLVIVVSFHGTFVTKVDRAYRCMCFFRNIKRVTNFIDISNIGTTELLDTAKMPTCLYTIHNGTSDGSSARYAKVSDKIVHLWECDDQNQGFLVHSCWVNDGRGNRFDLLDIDGCAIDPIILPDVKYEPSLNKASVETWGFKFSDTSVLNFQCVVELCKKALGECNGLTPPNCGRGKRSADKRHAGRRQDEEFDLIAHMDVLDHLDPETQAPGIPPTLLNELNGVSRNADVFIGGDGYSRMCLSSLSLGTFFAMFVVLFITATATTSILCFRMRNMK